MENDPYETVNVWMRQSNLNPRQLIPALLRYDHKKLMEKSTQVKIKLSPNVILINSLLESSDTLFISCRHLS